MHGRCVVAAAAAAMTLALGCGADEDAKDEPAAPLRQAAADRAGKAPAASAPRERTDSPASLPARSASVREVARGVPPDVGERPKLRVAPAGRPPEAVKSIPVARADRGPRARRGDLVAVRYTATTWAKAKEFDATWDRGDDVFPFVLGSKGVMPGFNEGVTGMRKGERKLVVIPPAAGYHAIGMQGAVDDSETLVFVVDL